MQLEAITYTNALLNLLGHCASNATIFALPELSPGYQERLEAINLCAEIRQEQGRPV